MNIVLRYKQKSDRIGGVLASVFASSAVDRGFESRSGQTKDYKICINFDASLLTTQHYKKKE